MGRSSNKSKNSGCGRLFLLVWGLGFAGIPIFMLSQMLPDMMKEAASRSWEKVECSIERSDIRVEESDDDPFIPQVDYYYTWQGQSFRSQTFYLEEKRFDEYEDAYLELQKHLNKTPQVCLVNPDNPSEAKLANKGILLQVGILAFMGVFVLIGSAAIYAAIRWSGKKKGSDGAEKKRKSSARKAKSKQVGGKKAGVIFGGIFLGGGLLILWFLFLGPMLKMQEAKGWQPVSCKILYSKIREHRGDDSTTYSVDIFYEYIVNDQRYKSNRYDFSAGSSSGYKSKRVITRQYPRGSKKVCYVNPDKPWVAVLNRDDFQGKWFGLIPLVFVLVGGGIMFASLKGKRQGSGSSVKQTRKGAAPSRRATTRVEHSGDYTCEHEVVLTGGKSRMGGCIGLGIFGLIWNGILSVFVVGLFKDGVQGLEWLFVIFLTPFLLVGLGVVLGLIHQFLCLFNAQVEVTVENNGCSVGDHLRLKWKMNSSRVKRFVIVLRCEQEARYRRGTSNVTDMVLCQRIEVVDTSREIEMRKGSAHVFIPEDAMHSWAAGSNKVKWTLQVIGEISLWPDVKDRHDILINPQLLEDDA